MAEGMQHLADEQLLQLCLADEQEAWLELRRRHVPALARFIEHLLHGQRISAVYVMTADIHRRTSRRLAMRWPPAAPR